MGRTLKLLLRAGVLAAGLAASSATAQTSAVSVTLGHNDTGSNEIMLDWRGAPVWHGLQPVVGASMSNRREGWLGAGLAYTWGRSAQGGFVRAAFMPGLYHRGNGRDLGGAVMFRSSLEVGLRLRAGGEVSLGVAHRSSGGIHSPNPGMNTAFLSYSMPLN